MHGVVAAGHSLTAQAGGDVLRAGGNAVDAALGAMLTSFVTEPLLTGFGAGGYLLVGGAGREPEVLDFFVAAPGQGADLSARAALEPVDVDFGDVSQLFNVGAASVGVYGTPSGVCEAARRFGTVPLAELAAPAAALARGGVPVSRMQAYIFGILEPIMAATAESRAHFMPAGRPAREGETFCDPDLGDALERLGAEGAAPFYTGEVAAAVVEWVAERGGTLTAEDLAAYSTTVREPVRVRYRGRTVLTNPPPSAGGILIAYALALLGREPGPPPARELVEVMERAQAERTAEFDSGLDQDGFPDAFLASRLGSTTHISVLDADGLACSITCTNGEGSGQIPAGTGVHLNNMMGEEDLSPLGFFAHRPGRRLPSMMCPTMVLRDDGEPELVLGSAGSNRIRSAILQVIVGVLDRDLDVAAAVEAPRVHFEDELVYAEPGVELGPLEADGREIARFRDRNLFFGGCQAVGHDPATGERAGAGDPRRGGAAVRV